MKYIRVIFIRNLPFFLLSLILVFFTFYQLSIGNVFLEEVDPTLILIIFLILVLICSFYLSTFSIKVEKGKVTLRMGFFKKDFDVSEIKEIEKVNLENFSYGVIKNNNIIMFVVDKDPCFKISLKGDEKIIIAEKRIKNFINILGG